MWIPNESHVLRFWIQLAPFDCLHMSIGQTIEDLQVSKLHLLPTLDLLRNASVQLSMGRPVDKKTCKSYSTTSKRLWK